MQYQIFKKNKNIEFFDGPLRGKILNPIWLRERLSDEKNLDKTSLQRLYEPSLIDDDLEIKDFYIDNNLLKITFTDGEIGKYLIHDLVNEINNYDVIPDKLEWNSSIDKLPYFDFNQFNKSEDLTIKMLSDFYSLGFVIITNVSNFMLSASDTLFRNICCGIGYNFSGILTVSPNCLIWTFSFILSGFVVSSKPPSVAPAAHHGPCPVAVIRTRDMKC